MSKIWFSADQHWCHKNAIQLCNRPYSDVEEMNESMVLKWNERVAPEDTIWCLGDFCWNKQRAQSFFDRLNGEKHLIIGNHDPRETLILPWASQPRDRKEIDVHDDEGIKTRLVLDHYGMRTWNGAYRGVIQLYGHSHGKLPGFRTSKGGGTLDVGVDSWNFYPISLSEIKARLQTLPEINMEVDNPQ